MFKYLFAVFGCVFFFAVSQPAKADVLTSGYISGFCIDMKDNTQAIIWPCHGAGNQQFDFRSGQYGELLTNGRCLSTSGAGGTQLVATTCNGSTAQKWVVTPQGALRNEQGWCADVEGGNRAAGTRIIAWNCANSVNQRWGMARFMSQAQAVSYGLVPPSTSSNLTAGQIMNRNGLLPAGIISRDGAGIVAAGGGNVVSNDGAGIVAAGGGNIVAAGGGNVLVPTAGIVAGGGGN